jgi:hypothetical protein
MEVGSNEEEEAPELLISMDQATLLASFDTVFRQWLGAT